MVESTLPAGFPERSLVEEILPWSERYIRQPDGPRAGEPWLWTDEQLRFLAWWYAFDERGQFLFHRGVLRRPKGWGKSPMVAAIALIELVGPCRVERGRAARHALPWVQLAGVSERQTQNTMAMVLGMCAESPIVADCGLDLGLTRILVSGGGRLEPITASAPTAEGARPSFVAADETHWWTEANGGAKLDRVIRRNLGKSRDGAARLLETTNAHVPGEASVAEASYEAWRAQVEGRTRTGGILYDSREAPSGVDLADEPALRAGLAAAYGDSTAWVDIDRLVAEIYDPATPPSEARRFYLNQLASSSDAFLTPVQWGACADPSIVVADGEQVTLGFDGSRKRARHVTDATALIGCRLSDGHLFQIGVWEQPEGPAGADWDVPVAEVMAAVDYAFATWDVVGFYADPARWESHVASWEAAYGNRLAVSASRGHPIEWWMTGGRAQAIVQATEEFASAVLDRELTHDGSFALTRHVLNARVRQTRLGAQIYKEHPDSPRKIDAAVAAILARRARRDALAAGVTTASRAIRSRRLVRL